MKPKIKNRVTLAKTPNNTYSVTWLTFCDGVTVRHSVWSNLTYVEARRLKREINNDLNS